MTPAIFGTINFDAAAMVEANTGTESVMAAVALSVERVSFVASSSKISKS
jgi:hypothetical protein